LLASLFLRCGDGPMQGWEQPLEIAAEMILAEFKTLSARQTGQAFRQLVCTRHPGPVDQHGNDADAALQGGLDLQPDEVAGVLAATLSAHRSAAFGVYVLAALGGDDAAGGRSSGCAVAGVVAVEEAGERVDEFEQQGVDLGLLVGGVLGAVAGDEPVPSGGCLLFVFGGLVPGLVAGLPPAQGFGPVHGAGWCW
jgi:hypothetical protein